MFVFCCSGYGAAAPQFHGNGVKGQIKKTNTKQILMNLYVMFIEVS